MDVGAGRGNNWLVSFAAQVFRRLALFPRSCRFPVPPPIPPRAARGLRLAEPIVRRRHKVGVGEILSLGIPGRVDQALDVAAAAQYEFVLSAEAARRSIAAFPGRNVV